MSFFDDSKDVLLVKLPGFLYDYLNEAAVRNEDLGVFASVVSVKGEGGKSGQTVLRIESEAEGLEGKPKQYELKAKPASQVLKAFAEQSDGRVGLVGTVTQRADAIPLQTDDKYAAMLAEKMKKKEVKHVETRVKADTKTALEEKRELAKRAREERQQKKSAVPDQWVEMTEEQLYEAILTLFAEREYWTRRDIVIRTDQKDKAVSEALKKLAIPHMSGEHKNEYSLKDEYKLHSRKRPKTEDGDEGGEAGEGAN